MPPVPPAPGFVTFGTGMSSSLTGSGSGTLQINYGAHTGSMPRTATIRIVTTGDGTPDDTTITLVQAGPHTIDVSRSRYDTTSASDDIFPLITIGGGATGWEATVVPPVPPATGFVTFGTGMSSTLTGSGSGTLQINYGENTGSMSRTATIRIVTTGDGTPDDTTITLFQLGPHNIDVSRALYDTTAAAGVVFPRIIIGGGVTGWEATVTTGTGFVNLGTTTATTLTGSGSGTLQINYGEHTGTYLVSRTATIRIVTTGDGMPEDTTITLTQAGVHTIDVSRVLYDTTAAAGVVSPQVIIGGGATGWEATVVPPVPPAPGFVTFGTGMSSSLTGSGSGTLQINYGEHTGSMPRTATIRIVTTGDGASEDTTITLIQAGVHTIDVFRARYDTTAAAGTIRPVITIGGGAGGWEASVPAGSFASFPSGSVGSASGVLEIDYLMHSGTMSRTTTITVTTTGDGTSVSETITLTQAGIHTVTAAPNSHTVTAAAGNVSSTITIGGGAGGWEATVTTGGGFVSLGAGMASSVTGNASGSLQINYANYTGTSDRTATITIMTTGDGASVSTTIMLTQEGVHTVTAVPDSHTVTEAMGNVSSTITIGGGATGWQASVPSGTFITVNPAPVTGSGSLSIDYDQNIGVERTGTITITTTGDGTTVTTTIMLTQAGGAPTITASPMSFTVDNTRGTSTTMITIGGGATGWSAVSNDAFITVSAGLVTGSGSLDINYDENIGVERIGTVTITTDGGTGTEMVVVTLTQSGPPAGISASPSSFPSEANTSGSVTTRITLSGGAESWTAAISDNAFITGINPTTAMASDGPTDVTITYAANTGLSRTGTVTFTTVGGTGTATAEVTVAQEGAAPQLSVSTIPSDLTVILGTEAGTIEVSIDIGGGAEGWTAISFDDFISLSEASGTGDGTFTITYSENTDATRNGTVRVTSVGGTGNSVTVDIIFRQLGGTIRGDLMLGALEDITEEVKAATRIEGALVIGDRTTGTDISNTHLSELSVEVITGDLILKDTKLTELNAFESLTHIIGRMEISANSRLISIEGFAALKSVRGSLSIVENLTPASVSGFPSLTSIGGDFSISSASSVSGFDAFIGVGGSFSISSTNSLSGFDVLRSIGSDFSISGNGLTSISEFASLTSVGKDFRISNNPMLTSISAFEALGSIKGNFWVDDNALLASISGFTSLVRIEGRLQIGGLTSGDNPELTSLPDFSNLRAIGGFIGAGRAPILIRRNQKLANCCGVVPFLETVLSNGYALGGNGMADIGDNATGCAMVEEVISRCGLPTVSVVTTPANLTTVLGIEAGMIAAAIEIGGSATGWAASTTDAFISFGNSRESAARGEGDGTLMITYTANAEAGTRTGTISIIPTGGGAIIAARTLTLTQLGLASIFGVDQEEKGDIKLYPNPVTDRLYIQGLQEKTMIHVSALNGISVRAALLTPEDSSIYLGDLPRGTYVVRAESRKRPSSSHLVVVE